MKDRKRERTRQKRVTKRKEKARRQAQQQQAEARRWRAFDVADRADEHLSRGEIADAVKAAARAAALDPHDLQIARLYVAAAEQSRDLAEQAHASA